jgi:hypothetical protein
MDINEELGRRRAEEAAASLAAQREAAAQRVATSRRQAADAAVGTQLRPLAQRFIQWANESRIEPETFNTQEQRVLFVRRRVPMQRGWRLSRRDIGEASGWGQPRIYLAVFTTGEIGWVGHVQGPIITVAEVEKLIVNFIMRSKSTVPWPK